MPRRRQRVGRAPDSYRRHAPKIEPYDVVLIVCEGAKTERNYFTRMRDVYRLSSANIEVTPANGSDPMSIVTYAERRRGKFDRVYCVFDRNSHQNYDAALRRIAVTNGYGKLVAITSWPCFEFWILLHFNYSSAAFEASGGRSPCSNVIVELRNHIPAYSKGHASIFDDLIPYFQIALENAKHLAKDNAATGSSNPSTKVHELVEYLAKLRAPDV